MVRATAQPETMRREPPRSSASARTGLEGNTGVQDGYKRWFDLAVVITAHVVLLPAALLLWTVIPIAIWLEDRGPVFYAQRRVGKNGRIFKLYKFRSMVRNAEALTGPTWASEGDPRITRVGRLMRSRALDELPQLINIIKGEMSLVGPRPERPEFVGRFVRDAPGFVQRLEATPGLTGLAQIYGRYASRPRVKLHYDMLYVKNMSPWVDVKILFLSLLVSLRARWQANDKRLGAFRRQTSGRPSRAKANRS